MWKINAPIKIKKAFGHGYFRLQLKSPELAAAARPGQFVNILTTRETTPFLRRPIGIEDVNAKEGLVSLLIKIVGPGTRLLGNVEAGDVVDLIGPLGNGFDLDLLPKRTFLVAGGTGIAPFLHLARKARENNEEKELVLFYGGRTKDDIVTLSDFKDLVAKSVVTTEDGSNGLSGLITLPLESELAAANPAETLVLACGPVGMMKAASELAAKFGTPCFVSLETVMGCGVGTCLGCAVQVRDPEADFGPENAHTGKTRFLRACKEGPVFNARDLTWEGLS